MSIDCLQIGVDYPVILSSTAFPFRITVGLVTYQFFTSNIKFILVDYPFFLIAYKICSCSLSSLFLELIKFVLRAHQVVLVAYKFALIVYQVCSCTCKNKNHAIRVFLERCVASGGLGRSSDVSVLNEVLFLKLLLFWTASMIDPVATLKQNKKTKGWITEQREKGS